MSREGRSCLSLAGHLHGHQHPLYSLIPPSPRQGHRWHSGPAGHPGQSPVSKSVIWSRLQRPHSQAPGSSMGICGGRCPADRTAPVAELSHMLGGIKPELPTGAASPDRGTRDPTSSGSGEPHPEGCPGPVPLLAEFRQDPSRARATATGLVCAPPGSRGAESHLPPAAQSPHQRWGQQRERGGTAGPPEHPNSPSLGSGL